MQFIGLQISKELDTKKFRKKVEVDRNTIFSLVCKYSFNSLLLIIELGPIRYSIKPS